LRDNASKAYDELGVCDRLSAAYAEQKTIGGKRKVQLERLEHSANAAKLFRDAGDPPRQAVSHLLSSELLLQLMTDESSGEQRAHWLSQMIIGCESAYESLSRSGRLDIAVRGLSKIVENLAYASTLVDEETTPGLWTTLHKHSKGLGASMALLLEAERTGQDCLTNSKKLGVYSNFAVGSDSLNVLESKKDFDSYAAQAFTLTGNRELLREAQRVSAETERLVEHAKPAAASVTAPPAQAYAFCENCGKQIPRDYAFCVYCGDKQGV
jgi:hypothetical protein